MLQDVTTLCFTSRHNGVSLGFSVWYYQYILPSSTLSFKYGHFWILKNQAGNQTDQKKTPI